MYNSSNILTKAHGNIILNSKNRNYYRTVYLNSEHWKGLRSEKLASNAVCENCGADQMLDVHHLSYRGLYDVRVKDLQTLCRPCHNETHKNKKKSNSDFAKKLKRREARRIKRERLKLSRIGDKEKYISDLKLSLDRRRIEQSDFTTYISIHY